ncbi:MAG TPA: VOC family protein [Myxococcota bacterium]|nr:VOC family protein [Myxococcota bacterium]
MPFHHLALVTRDAPAVHVFYTEAMGFELVKTEVGATPGGGWAKHFFYETGGGELMAFWELHDDTIPEAYPTAISAGIGLPEWVNHIAFAANDLGDLDRRRDRLVSHGYDVLEIDHGWCRSIYTRDPNGTLVEFCVNTRPFDANDRREALESLRQAKPALKAPPPQPKLHHGNGTPAHLRERTA